MDAVIYYACLITMYVAVGYAIGLAFHEYSVKTNHPRREPGGGEQRRGQSVD